MNCKKIQELMLTDYIDARMGDKQKSFINQHLFHCGDCKEFLRSVKEGVVNPFVNVPRTVPNERLWGQIVQTIEKEQLQQVEKNFIPVLWEKLRHVVHIPRPAFAFASIVTIIFMTGSIGQLFINSQVVKVNGQDQVEYLASLIDEPLDVAGNNGNDSQTSIEKYFL